MRAVARELDEMGIPFAIAGALAGNAHGHRRMTEDVDLLLTREGLARFKQSKLGLGWVELFAGSKGMRDTTNNVKLDILLAGDFPGDGKPKPVVFPDPAALQPDRRDGLPFIDLPLLLELKLASGMTAPHRLQDLADVMSLIRVRALPQDYSDHLNPYVRGKFQEMWALAQVQDEY